jgi:murein L,D-transpeptidase YafK
VIGRNKARGPSILVLGALLLLVGACNAVPPQGGGGHIRADRVVLEKTKRQLHLFTAGKVVRTYQVALGRTPVGPKTREGDGKTPEGQYLIDSRNSRSAYHRALHISYPSVADVERARRSGVKPGGDIMIHGIRNGFGWIGPLHRTLDWTQGCIAVTNREIEEIWAAVPDGTPIEMKP